ncbi:MAG: DUF4159 domain-containing protein [bacterium]
MFHWPVSKRLLSLALVVFVAGGIRTTAAQDLFAIARVHYDGGGDWYSDPSSLVNLQKAAVQVLGIPMAPRETTVRLLDPDLFRHPYLYMTGHGNIRFSDEEASRLRDYLLSGGFLHADDNYGMDESFRREIRKVFPDRELVEIPFTHPIYHMVYDFPNGLPKIHYHDGLPAQGFGIVMDGRIVLFYSYQCDLGDGWEDPEVHHDPEEKRQAALHMGVNLIAYALSGKPAPLP